MTDIRRCARRNGSRPSLLALRTAVGLPIDYNAALVRTVEQLGVELLALSQRCKNASFAIYRGRELQQQLGEAFTVTPTEVLALIDDVASKRERYGPEEVGVFDAESMLVSFTGFQRTSGVTILIARYMGRSIVVVGELQAAYMGVVSVELKRLYDAYWPD
jgi:hypothetical protein